MWDLKKKYLSYLIFECSSTKLWALWLLFKTGLPYRWLKKHWHTKYRFTWSVELLDKIQNGKLKWNFTWTVNNFLVYLMQYLGYECVLSRFSTIQLCATPWSSTGFSVHGILQARILEWVAMPSSRGSFQPKDQTLISHVSCIGQWVLHH